MLVKVKGLNLQYCTNKAGRNRKNLTVKKKAKGIITCAFPLVWLQLPFQSSLSLDFFPLVDGGR